MSPKTLAAIPAVLFALSAVPAFALDISVGGSAGGSASGSSGDSGFSAGFDASASASASAGHSDDDSESSAGASVSGSGSVSGDVSGSVDAGGGDDPLLDVMLLIKGSNWTEASFSGIGDVDGTTYDVDAWINSDNSAEFNQTLEAHADEIADLQASLAANAELSAWLESENTDASAVVAVGVKADGSLAVFTHD